ncbi:MAG: nucleoside recognition protein [Lachnospiraceae bacterium]|nr:nucleoside recognition protein [Lachnospiraceae bacterium]
MKKSKIFSVIMFLALAPMLYHADYVTEGARYGLLLWYNSVVPALFPFMVLSGLIVSGGGVQILMEPVYRLLRPFLPITKDGCYVLVSGLLCGYPMGAKTCADFVRDGQITEHEGRFLMAICNHPSPMFVLGYVYPFFAEFLPVWQLLICIYAPVILLAFIAKKVYQHSDHSNPNKKKGSERISNTRSNINPVKANEERNIRKKSADETILSSIEILCKIGGYLVLFSIVIVFLRHAAWIPTPIRLALIGGMEMTTGIRELTASLPFLPAFISSIAALTFGGLSGIFQTKAVIANSSDSDAGPSSNEKKAGLSIRPYIFWKLIHAALSAGVAFFLCIMLQ